MRIAAMSDIHGNLWALALPTIAGNHERQVLTHAPERMGASDLYAHRQLTQRQREWIAGLPATQQFNEDVLMVHGTPGSDVTYWLETVVAPGGMRAASYQEVVERSAGASSSLVLCGHTHVPRAVQLDDGRLIVNPGSVGLQAYDDAWPYPHVVENGTPHARYAVVEKLNGVWRVCETRQTE